MTAGELEKVMKSCFLPTFFFFFISILETAR